MKEVSSLIEILNKSFFPSTSIFFSTFLSSKSELNLQLTAKRFHIKGIYNYNCIIMQQISMQTLVTFLTTQTHRPTTWHANHEPYRRCPSTGDSLGTSPHHHYDPGHPPKRLVVGISHIL